MPPDPNESARPSEMPARPRWRDAKYVAGLVGYTLGVVVGFIFGVVVGLSS